MLLLGIDLGTSFIKVSIVDSATGSKVASAQYPETEAEIISVQKGWAEQDPERWWTYTKKAILKANAEELYNPKDIQAIGIAYQMHGLVLVDRALQPLRNAIIWCDSRAVEIGNTAFETLQHAGFLQSHLNSPGNFTASKLAWVKENEPEIYSRIYKFMLPGDFISMRLTQEINSNPSSISEGILWDFEQDSLSDRLLDHYGIDRELVPDIQPVFSVYGKVAPEVAQELGLSSEAVVSYKAGDQPNNALSLGVLDVGEVAATAGTSGVIYAVADHLLYDRESRVNSFAHVGHSDGQTNIGVLLCINGTGIQNSWIRKLTGAERSYAEINAEAAQIAVGSEGILVLPFGNGAERMLNNKTIHGHVENLDFVRHSAAHIWRAVQEGIACSFRYGLDIIRENDIHPTVIKAGHANMFLSPLFQQAFADVNQVAVELYEQDGSVGAALGAGIGAGIFRDKREAVAGLKRKGTIEPQQSTRYEELYSSWLQALNQKLNQSNI
ncbi:xylulokinase [Sphingobacterium lactis]|uniref:Xylulokinase n=1 Tax=Sphingobacterium lactis TaxID=797291 RepID=A0A1H6B4S0_9SPHI|nr:FGGY family carbohydrate kinase [Sphingobacterium lactis]SEG55375.1 xylulokinase [Sphingobacterium lactis]